MRSNFAPPVPRACMSQFDRRTYSGSLRSRIMASASSLSIPIRSLNSFNAYTLAKNIPAPVWGSRFAGGLSSVTADGFGSNPNSAKGRGSPLLFPFMTLYNRLEAWPDGRLRRKTMHILLIEDNPGDVRLLREALREKAVSFQVSVVEDGDQALAFLRREGEYAYTSRPDLVLLDLNLPKTDGRVVLQALRATPERKRIPIMILTGVLQDADQQQAAALEVERFLRKP